MGEQNDDQADGIKSAYMWCSIAVALFLISALIIYFVKWRHSGIKILEVLAILLINQTLETIFEAMSYIDQQNNSLCTISLIGSMAFTVAANFWVIFITRLIYREALAPGKFFNLVNFFLRNIVVTYLPSLVLGIFLFIMIQVGDTKSETKCWKIVTQTQIQDYIIYFTSFIVPNLGALIIISGYLYWYKRIPTSKWTFYLLFPIVTVIFSLYYIIIKSYVLFDSENKRISNLQIPLLAQSIIYGALFLIISKKNNQNKKVVSSDLTIKDSEIEASFIDDL